MMLMPFQSIGSSPITTIPSLYLGTLKAVEPAFTLIASFACSPSGNFLKRIITKDQTDTINLIRCGYGLVRLKK